MFVIPQYGHKKLSLNAYIKLRDFIRCIEVTIYLFYCHYIELLIFSELMNSQPTI